jgi:hypothetical protein
MCDKNKTLPRPFIIIIVISTLPISIPHISATTKPISPKFGPVVRALPQRWVQFLAKSAKRLSSYRRVVGGWGRGRIYFYVVFSHFSLFTAWALEMAS